MLTHIGNFPDCIGPRQKAPLEVEAAGYAQEAITIVVRSYRQGKVPYFDEKNIKVVDKPVKA